MDTAPTPDTALVEDTADFDGLRLTATGVWARAHRGGPLSGATASLGPCPGQSRDRPPRWRRHGGTSDRVEVVIDAPTWTVRHLVPAGRERDAAAFVTRVNTAVTRAAAANWSPAPTPAAS